MLIVRILRKIYKIPKAGIYTLLLTILFIYCSISKRKNINNNENNEKSILFIAGFGKYGGTRTYVEDLLAKLEKNNYKIHIIFNKNNINAEGLNLIKSEKMKYNIYNYSFNNLFYMLVSITYFYKLINKKNINTTIISEGDCGYYIPCILLKTQNILIEHTIPGKIDRYRQRMINKIKSNSKIVCVSNFQKNVIIENWGKHLINYCSVVYNSSSYNSAFLIKNKFNTKKKKIITVAHFIYYKNPDMWLSIARKLTEKYSELEFIWIGDGDELMSYKNIIGENNAIKLLGYCNHDQIKEEYENAFLYLALSKIESLGIAVIDALYAGLPAIVLNTGGLPEVVDSEKCGYVVNSEDEAIEKIEVLLKDEELYQNMKRSALERYNMLFTKEEWEKNIISLIGCV